MRTAGRMSNAVETETTELSRAIAFDLRIGQRWEANPGVFIKAPTRCRRQVQEPWWSRTSRPVPANCLWPKSDKSPGLRAKPRRQPTVFMSFYFLNKIGFGPKRYDGLEVRLKSYPTQGETPMMPSTCFRVWHQI